MGACSTLPRHHIANEDSISHKIECYVKNGLQPPLKKVFVIKPRRIYSFSGLIHGEVKIDGILIGNVNGNRSYMIKEKTLTFSKYETI